MNQIIHPEALRATRKQRGLSQKALAERCGCSVEQVSRWERGITRHVRAHSRKRLTSVLAVDWEVLTRVPDDEAKTTLWSVPTVQLNHRVRGGMRTALDIVSLRYGVRPADIIELAPLLFLITAEQSLIRRQKNIDAIAESLDRAAQEAQEAAPHLAPAFYPRYEVDEAIDDEQKSIDDRDVFRDRVKEPYDVEEEDRDPYTTYLKSLVEDLSPGLVDDIDPNSSGAPTYTIAWDTLRKVTGISEADENGQDLLRYVWEGRIDLREVLTRKRDLSPEQYRNWLSDRYDTVKAAVDAAIRLDLEHW